VVEQIDRLDRRNVRRCVVSATFAVAILLACALQWRLAAPVDAEGTPAASPVATAQPAPGDNANGPLQVTVGLYVLEIHELDQQASTYKADFYLWMRWRGAFDPTPTIELLNNTDRWTLTMTPIYTKPINLPSGEQLQQFHIQGSFFDALDLRDYPLDRHALTIELEDSTYPSDQLIYVPDTAQSQRAPPSASPGGTSPAGISTSTGTRTRRTSATPARRHRSTHDLRSRSRLNARRAFSAGSCCCHC
jgi:hypothetical protein